MTNSNRFEALVANLEATEVGGPFDKGNIDARTLLMHEMLYIVGVCFADWPLAPSAHYVLSDKTSEFRFAFADVDIGEAENTETLISMMVRLVRQKPEQLELRLISKWDSCDDSDSRFWEFGADSASVRESAEEIVLDLCSMLCTVKPLAQQLFASMPQASMARRAQLFEQALDYFWVQENWPQTDEGKALFKKIYQCEPTTPSVIQNLNRAQILMQKGALMQKAAPR